MPRIRYLKPDFFKDEDLAKLPYETRLFFAGLWGLADKAGRLEDRPERLKIEIFPYNDIDTEKCLEQLSHKKLSSGQPFINRYQTDEQRYIQIINWQKHQKPHHTERESEIPPYNPPLMEKGMGMEKQLNPSRELRNGEVTVKQPLNKQYTIDDVKDACVLNEIPESNAQSYFDQYNSQDWKKANGQLITNLQSHIAKRWNKNKQCWDFDEKKQDAQPKSKEDVKCIICGKHATSYQSNVGGFCSPAHYEEWLKK